VVHNVRRVWQQTPNRGRVPSPVVLFGVEQELEEFGLNNVVGDIYVASRVVHRLLLLMWMSSKRSARRKRIAFFVLVVRQWNAPTATFDRKQ
jgi:hypothetical protein